MRISRVVTAVLVTGSACFGFLPLAHASTENQTVVPSVEAWYQPNPTCTSPAGCVGLGQVPAAPPTPVPTTAFPAGSLHVAVDAGQETARSYLSFSLPLFDGELTGASLDIPLDVAQGDGSVSPETAKIVVCAFHGSITPADGSLDAPPTATCSSGTKAVYVATPAPHLHADLTPLVSELSSGAGVALLPDASVAQTDAWHVVFSAHNRADAAKTAPATMAITLDTTDEPIYNPPPVEPLVGAAPPPPLSTITGSGLIPVPQVPVVQNPAPSVPQAMPQARTVTVGYAYPAVWLLPLAFLLVVPVVARALTQDLTPGS